MEDYCATVNLEYLKKCFEEGDAEINVEYWSESLDGEKICVRQSFIMTWDDDTGDIMVMVVAKEITGQVKKQMEQTQALRMLCWRHSMPTMRRPPSFPICPMTSVHR